MEFNRVWAMPNSNTFQIKPINALIRKYITVGGDWVDPYANNNVFKNSLDGNVNLITNDLNPDCDTMYHIKALDFLKQFNTGGIDGVLYDPPYSVRQVSECYKKYGYEVTQFDTRSNYYTNDKDQITRIVKSGGLVLSFGWNSGGIGKNNGFDILEILLVPHGGPHNDTICVVERKR